ncbi:hypothetical protein E3N88_19425 [Mikania micrantha]|uniref:Uncharacterized protein n=1 Tax=Mikania micrantha TaxID=192012 RepID=A0A5N6NPJ1_9ASTR|nr:hypothetical protein E3N88_19425 [Mikania micrantha]
METSSQFTSGQFSPQTLILFSTRDFKIRRTKSKLNQIAGVTRDSWEQFRINGPVDVIDGSNQGSMKLQVRTPSLSDQPTQVPSPLDPSACPAEAFCLLVLDPHQVDYLNLKNNERISFSRKIVNDEISWNPEKVNP